MLLPHAAASIVAASQVVLLVVLNRRIVQPLRAPQIQPILLLLLGLILLHNREEVKDRRDQRPETAVSPRVSLKR